MSLTAEDVNRTEFGNAAIGRRGYAKHEVDEFLRRAGKTLNDEDDLTAAEVHHVTFNKPLIGKRGYDERAVDEFLDQLEDELANRSGAEPQAHQVPAARAGAEATNQRAEPRTCAERPAEDLQDS